jgi:hypothetical protein
MVSQRFVGTAGAVSFGRLRVVHMWCGGDGGPRTVVGGVLINSAHLSCHIALNGLVGLCRGEKSVGGVGGWRFWWVRSVLF